jgi:hypothetical protein
MHASIDHEVVVREIPTSHRRGTYYLVVNTSMRPTKGLRVHFPAREPVRDLVLPRL